MNAIQSLLTDHLDIWTSALLTKSTAGRGGNGKLEAYGIKKLRELILDLAMRGKLIEQDQNDAPPYVALRKTKHWPLKVDKNSGHIPDSWISVPIEVLAADTKYPIGDGDHGQIKPSCYTDMGVPYIRVADLGWGTFEPNGLVHIPESVHEQNLKSELLPGDILIAKTGATIGKCCIVPASISRANTTSSVGKVTVNQYLVLPKWIICYFLSGGFKEEMWAVSKKTAQPGFNIINLKRFVVPVPPIAEQHRIVAKVDELMALCDQLEQQQTDSIAAHQTLVETLLGTLTRVESQQEFSAAWARIASHFDTLFTTEASIDQLKQTILQLAVMGKLVPQDPNDEDVQILLTRSDLRRSEVAESDRRTDSGSQPILSADDRWEIPESWYWRGLADLVLFVDYRGKTPTKQSSGIRLLTAKNVRKGQIDLMPEEFLTGQEYKDWMTRGLPKVGDVLFTTEAPMGNAAVVELTEQFALAQRVICFQNYGALAPAFLVMQILSNQFQSILDKNGTGMTAKGIKASKLKQLPIAIPPLAEQHRIVAKAEELMALCDALKARLADAQAIQTHLADAIVEQAVC